MNRHCWKLLRFLIVPLAVLVTVSAVAAADDAGAVPAQTVWRLLDYLAVDYRGAVGPNGIISETEYAEMTEFAQSVQTRLGDLPRTPTTPHLLEQAQTLRTAIADKATPEDVARIARALARDLLVAYPVPLAPTQPPDPARGAALYAENCTACHGAQGMGDGPAAKTLNPPPIAFTNEARARERSLFGLYQVISQGLEGTPMVAFDRLSPADRWALAFQVGRFAYPDAKSDEGKRIWTADPQLHTLVPNLTALVQARPVDLVAHLGEANGQAVTAYLRNHAEAVVGQGNSSLDLAQARLTESLKAYEAGDRAKATDLALSAYLDGIEPIEPALKARDAALVTRIEQAMIALRDAIAKNAPVSDIQQRVQDVWGLIQSADRALVPGQAADSATFLGAFTVLLREGIEALLIVVAMLAFLQKAGRREVVGYVHAGWVAALAAGVGTWFAATYLVSISGASRELTEGIGSLIAAVVLVSVGIWMHGKSNAQAWQKYIAEKMSHALTRKSAWFLFGLAFVVVYREVFETILFYVALWTEGGASQVLLGAGLGAVALVGVAWVLLRYSRTLPIGQFFLYSSLMIAVLAVVLAGKGIAALQEAGWLDVRPIAAVPRIEVIGLYPTWQGVAAQVVTLCVLVAAFWFNASRVRNARGDAAS